MLDKLMCARSCCRRKSQNAVEENLYCMHPQSTYMHCRTEFQFRTNTFCYLEEYIKQSGNDTFCNLENIHFKIWTNKFCNLNTLYLIHPHLYWMHPQSTYHPLPHCCALNCRSVQCRVHAIENVNSTKCRCALHRILLVYCSVQLSHNRES